MINETYYASNLQRWCVLIFTSYEQLERVLLNNRRFIEIFFRKESAQRSMCPRKIIKYSKVAVVLVLFPWTKIYGMSPTPSASDGSSTESKEVKKFDDIIKPPNDKYSYRGLILINELKIMLVSDPSTAKSAAAMEVGVGALNDPHDTQGLTNLLGCLLMRTTASQTDNFDELLRAHDGNIHQRAKTTSSEQSFSFTTGSKHFIPALKRFAKFFLEPVVEDLNEEMLKKGLKCVQKDHLQRANDDSYRIHEVEKLLCTKNHPYGHSFIGNYKSLYANLSSEPMLEDTKYKDLKLAQLHAKLRALHSSCYSSNIMTLAVLGKESLDELEQLVVPLFEKLENKNLRKLVIPFKYHPWPPEQLAYKIYVVPKENIQILRMTFPIPTSTKQNGTLPIMFINLLLSCNGPKTLLYQLREKGYCNDITTEETFISQFGFFVIKISLTANGITHVDDIIKMVSEFIYLLNSFGTTEQIFNEYKRMCELDFLNQSPDRSPWPYVVELASSMQENSLENCVSCGWLPEPWKEKCIIEFLCHVSLDNMNITVVSKSFESIADQTELHYGTKYKIEKLSDTLLQDKWYILKEPSNLKLPPTNKFIPGNTDVIPLETNAPEYPCIIHESLKCRFWYKQENEFPGVNLFVRLEVISRRCQSDAFMWAMTNILVHMVRSMLDESTFGAKLVDYVWVIEPSDHGIHIRLNGYTEKLHVLLQEIILTFSSIGSNLKKKRFQDMKEKYIQYLMNLNINIEDRLNQATWFHEVLVSEYNWTTDDLLVAAKMLQYSDMRKFIKTFFSRMFLLGFVHGNCNKKIANNIVNIVERYFKSNRGLLYQETLKARPVEIEPGSHLIYRKFYKNIHENFYCVYFQLTSQPYRPTRFRTILLSIIFLRLITDFCNTNLAEKEHKPIMMTCALLEKHGGRGFVMTAHSEKNPSHIDLKVEKFLLSVPGILKSVTSDEFKQVKRKIYTDEITIRSLKVLSTFYWHEIVNRYFIFDKRRMMYKNLQSLSLKDVIDFFMERIHVSSPKRRKLAIHAFPKKSRGAQWYEYPADSQAIKIKILPLFKSTMVLSRQ